MRVISVFHVALWFALAWLWLGATFHSHSRHISVSMTPVGVVRLLFQSVLPFAWHELIAAGGKEQQCIYCEKQNKNPEKGNLRASLD